MDAHVSFDDWMIYESEETAMATQTCSHGRPVDGPTLWDVLTCAVVCDDCETEEWTRARASTVVGVLVLLALLLLPAMLLLAGVFW